MVLEKRARLVLGATGLVGLVVIGLASTLRPAPSAPTAHPVEGALTGFCEASAILPWEGGYLVGDNETSDRLYQLGTALEPLAPLDLPHEIEDIEALARGPSGELIVVGSQSANKKGKLQPERERVLALGSTPVRPDLSSCGPCMAARGRPPKEGGLSVEGAATWRGSFYLGLRSPLVGGEALLLRMGGEPGASLAVQETLRLDLGGLGIRDLVPDGEGLLLLAGPPDGADAPHRLYRLDAPGSPPVLEPVDLPAGSEGMVVEGEEILVVIDGDGKPGEPCRQPARWSRARRSVAAPRDPHEG